MWRQIFDWWLRRGEEARRIPRRYRTGELIAHTYFRKERNDRVQLSLSFYFFFLLFMEHNRLAEEGYYLAIPSGRTKNFILSEREPFAYDSAFSLSPAGSCSWFFFAVSPFSRPPAHRPVRSGGNTARRFSLACNPLAPFPGFSSVHPFARKTRVTRSDYASLAGVPRQQSKIKIQKSAGGKNRRKLDKSRPASAFFAHLPLLRVYPVASLLFNSAVKRDRAGREGWPILSGRLTPESQNLHNSFRPRWRRQ